MEASAFVVSDRSKRRCICLAVDRVCRVGLYRVKSTRYSVAVTQPLWPAALIATIAGEVRRYRKDRDMSAQKLADRTAELGYEVPRSVIANLESGRRSDVSLAEVLVLGAALQVPPMLLAFPAGRVEQVEVIPGVSVPPWDALFWSTGVGFPGLPPVLEDKSGVTEAINDHHQMVTNLQHTLYRYAREVSQGQYRLKGDKDDEFRQRDRQRAVDVVQSLAKVLRVHRQSMREMGLIPPVLDHPQVVALTEDSQMPDGAELAAFAKALRAEATSA
jgi:transcriptional regulator with XRE-family HTH domain